MDAALQRLLDRWATECSAAAPIQGATHGVYRLEVGGEPRVLKVYRSAEAAGTEHRVLHLLEEHDYPAPRVVEANPTGAQHEAPFLLMEDRGRDSVAGILASGAADAPRLAAQMGELLARAHEIQLPESGAIRSDRIEPLDVAAIAKEIHAAAVGLHAQNLIDLVTREAVLAIEDVPLGGNSLCHMDFHPVQCVVNGARLTAVVDWEGAWSANPEIDLAVAHAYFEFYGIKGATDEFLRAYGESSAGRLVELGNYATFQALHLTALAAKWLQANQLAGAKRAASLLIEHLRTTR